MQYKIKFNLFQYDKYGFPVIMQNKTIYLKSDNYDNARNQVLSLYPGAKCIIIFLEIDENIENNQKSQNPADRQIWELIENAKKHKNHTFGNSNLYALPKCSPGLRITRDNGNFLHLPFKKMHGNPPITTNTINNIR